MNKTLRVAVVCGLAVLATSDLTAQEKPSRGIVGATAPSWEVKQWARLPDGEESLDISSFRGKVVYLYCFQSWCPGCHRRGFPTLVEVQNHYKNDPLVTFVAVQTTFEGERINTFENAQNTTDKFRLTIPVGQSGGGGQRSALMKSYRTGGTPWTIIIDREGVVRFNNFHIDPKEAIAFIDKLKK